MNAHTPISEDFSETARFLNLDRLLCYPFKLRRTTYAVLGGVEISIGTLSQVTQPKRAGCVVFPLCHRPS
jgi:hypothetical protein